MAGVGIKSGKGVYDWVVPVSLEHKSGQANHVTTEAHSYPETVFTVIILIHL